MTAAMIPVCFVILTLISLPEPGKPAQPDRPWRVYRGPNTGYGAPERDAAGRTFAGARSVVSLNRGSLYVRETPEEIDRKPCADPGG